MLTQELLKQAVCYNKENGIFTRREKSAKRVQIGDVAGSLDSSGHVQFKIFGRTYLAHRLAFLYMTGEWTVGEVDHIDGVRNNNAWINLRVGTKNDNQQNQRKPRADNKTGFLGVCKHKQCNKFIAKIRTNGVVKYLGLFATPEEAHQAYLTAKRELHNFCSI